MEPGRTRPAEQPSSSKDPQQEQQQQTFIASRSFTGVRKGYIFTTGDQGTGYYKDSPLHLRPKQAAKAKPVLLKSSSIVKGLQRKPAVLPDAKKRKTDSDSTSKPTYLKEMERYNAMNCSSHSGDRPLVK